MNHRDTETQRRQEGVIIHSYLSSLCLGVSVVQWLLRLHPVRDADHPFLGGICRGRTPVLDDHPPADGSPALDAVIGETDDDRSALLAELALCGTQGFALGGGTVVPHFAALKYPVLKRHHPSADEPGINSAILRQ